MRCRSRSTLSGTGAEIVDIKQVIAEFGPFERISRGREAQLLRHGLDRHLLTLVGYERAYEDIPEAEQPSDAELVERGETKEDFTRGAFEGFVGHHLVNVEEVYESAKPMPRDLRLGDDDIWFGDDGLPQ